jgi:hypothetical protein
MRLDPTRRKRFAKPSHYVFEERVKRLTIVRKPSRSSSVSGGAVSNESKREGRL